MTTQRAQRKGWRTGDGPPSTGHYVHETCPHGMHLYVFETGPFAGETYNGCGTCDDAARCPSCGVAETRPDEDLVAHVPNARVCARGHRFVREPEATSRETQET